MRHAWLILTHGSFEILEKQLRFFDSENADFFIHVDAKAELDAERFLTVPEKSRVTFVSRHCISWGHFAMVEAELELLRAAVPGGYERATKPFMRGSPREPACSHCNAHRKSEHRHSRVFPEFGIRTMLRNSRARMQSNWLLSGSQKPT